MEIALLAAVVFDAVGVVGDEHVVVGFDVGFGVGVDALGVAFDRRRWGIAECWMLSAE